MFPGAGQPLQSRAHPETSAQGDTPPPADSARRQQVKAQAVKPSAVSKAATPKASKAKPEKVPAAKMPKTTPAAPPKAAKAAETAAARKPPAKPAKPAAKAPVPAVAVSSAPAPVKPTAPKAAAPTVAKAAKPTPPPPQADVAPVAVARPVPGGGSLEPETSIDARGQADTARSPPGLRWGTDPAHQVRRSRSGPPWWPVRRRALPPRHSGSPRP